MRGTVNIEGKLPVDFYQEGKSVIACCPVLDLVTCGDDYAEAEKNFREILEVFFHECATAGTLEDVLLACGWLKATKSRKTTMQPPVFLGREDVAIPAVQKMAVA